MQLLTRGISVVFAVLITIVCHAQTTDNGGYPDYKEEVFMDMDFEPNLLTPEVPAKLKDDVARYMVNVADNLKRKFTVDLMRDGDVFVLTIPTDDLFFPNDTLLSPYASKTLNELIPLMKDPYMYKVVMSIHTDDTGSEIYRDMLSTARLNSIYDWLMDEIDAQVLSEDLVVIPYSMGSSEPLVSNDTRQNRTTNRRLELYFIPGPKMIELASRRVLN